MARRPRLEYPAATYHVFGRGNRRANIFIDDNDYRQYLETLSELAGELGVEVLAYCLMPNHPHLALRTNRVPLSKFMQRLNSRHANRFNRKYKQCGHLYQGRYRAILVDSDNYLLRLVRYIHQNPLRAGLVAHLGDWAHSSHRQYLHPSTAWVSSNAVLARTGGIEGYLTFVGLPASSDDISLFSAASDGFAFGGGAEHAERLGRWVSASVNEPHRWESTSLRRICPVATVESLAREWALKHEIELVELQSKSQREPIRSLRRKLATTLREQGHLVREIGRLLCREEAAVSRLVSRATSKGGYAALPR